MQRLLINCEIEEYQDKDLREREVTLLYGALCLVTLNEQTERSVASY